MVGGVQEEGGSKERINSPVQKLRLVWFSMHVQVSHSACVMTTAVICKLLRSKEATATVDIRNWPPVLDTGTKLHPLAQTPRLNTKKAKNTQYHLEPLVQ